MIKTTVYLASDQMAARDALAKREARPKAEIIRDAVGRYVNDQGTHLPKAVGIFEDHEVDSTNIDDWLRANWRPEIVATMPVEASEP